MTHDHLWCLYKLNIDIFIEPKVWSCLHFKRFVRAVRIGTGVNYSVIADQIRSDISAKNTNKTYVNLMGYF